MALKDMGLRLLRKKSEDSALERSKLNLEEKLQKRRAEMAVSSCH